MSPARRAIVASLLTTALVCALLPSPPSAVVHGPSRSTPGLLDDAWSAGDAPSDPLGVAASERTAPSPGARLPVVASPPPPLSLAQSWARHDAPGHALPAWRCLARAPQFARPPPALAA